MLKRIALILQTQNLTVSQFADRIGVQRSALSHVLGGRNNPSLDFVTKILRTFPEIRSQWLLFGEGKMYDAMTEVRSAEEAAVSEVAGAVSAVAPDMPSRVEAMPEETAGMVEPERPVAVEMAAETMEAAPESEGPLSDMAGFEAVQPEDSRLVKVVFFYSDGRFEEYARR